MNTQQIEYCLSKNPHTYKIFQGVYPADLLPTINKIKKPLLIANTKSSKHVGEHWVAFFVDKRKKVLEIFDSSGKTTIHNNKHFASYFKKNFSGMQVKYSTLCIQHFLSNICGVYCLVYALYKSKNISLEKFLQLFTLNSQENDKKVLNIFENNFRKYYDYFNKNNKCIQISKNLYLCKENNKT